VLPITALGTELLRSTSEPSNRSNRGRPPRPSHPVARRGDDRIVSTEFLCLGARWIYRCRFWFRVVSDHADPLSG
jgi:hypothetical protein